MSLPSDIIKPVIRPPGDWHADVKPGTPFRDILKLVNRRQDICITGTYGFAMSFYAWLKKYIATRYPVHDYLSSRRNRGALFERQSRIWIRFKNRHPELSNSPENPWLAEFYPENDDFLMTFSDYLGMNGARQWFEKGIQYPVVSHRVHPFYGTYFPSRYDHLALFDRWLSDNKDYARAVDIGCGCGILSLVMLKHGIRKIHATDINPNAVYSFQQDIKGHLNKKADSIFIEKANLLGSFAPQASDLIVFNPPWIPGPAEKTLDLATYYDAGFFDRFFFKMVAACPTGTDMLLLFSNFAIVAGLTSEHPISKALNKHNSQFQLNAFHKEKLTQKPSKKEGWLWTLREKEEIELYLIKRV